MGGIIKKVIIELILKDCFYGIAPMNARKEAKKNSDYVTESFGSEGAVLDACLKIKKLFF